MIIHAIILSFQITAIYILFQEGMLLERLRSFIERIVDAVCIFFAKKFVKGNPLAAGMKASKYLLKPIFGCVICMASVWTIILTWSFNLPLILLVCGINVLIDKIINYEAAT